MALNYKIIEARIRVIIRIEHDNSIHMTQHLCAQAHGILFLGEIGIIGSSLKLRITAIFIEHTM